MEKLIGLLAVLLALSGCSDAQFTAEPPIGLGAAGSEQAGAGPEGGAGDTDSAAGAAGAGGAASAGQGGSDSAAGMLGTAGTAETVGGAPAVTTPPCQDAIDAPSHGYLALQKDTCYRTEDVFNTITCGGTGWAERTIKINGALATCDSMGVFPDPIAGYTYIEIDGGLPGSDWLRWSESE